MHEAVVFGYWIDVLLLALMWMSCILIFVAYLLQLWKESLLVVRCGCERYGGHSAGRMESNRFRCWLKMKFGRCVAGACEAGLGLSPGILGGSNDATHPLIMSV